MTIIRVGLACECEHECHWSGSHAYGTAQPDVQPVKTDYGTFHLCATCRAENHMPPKAP